MSRFRVPAPRRAFVAHADAGVSRGPRRLTLLVALIAALLVVAPTAALGARLIAQDDPSPAEGHAQVVAHGVAAVPDGQVAWRVVSDTAELEDDAATEERALGFALADEDAILVNDLTYGTQARLAAGEATFVPTGTQQQRIALGNAAAEYYRIALVAAGDAQDAGGDDLLFTGEGFNAAGNRDLDLIRDNLAADEEGTLEDTGFPTLVLATSGEIEVETEDGAAPTSLAAGEAAEFEGALSFTTTGTEDATFVAAVVGPEVPALPTPTPAPTGTLALTVALCPPDYDGPDFEEDCTEPAADVPFNLIAGDEFDPDAEVIATAETDADGTTGFVDLLPGDFVVAADIPGDFAQSVAFCQDAAGTDVAGDTDNPNAVTVAVAAGAEISCAWYILREDAQGAGPGSVTVAVRACPVGQRPETVVGDFCDPATDGGYAFSLTSIGTGVALTLDDATAAGPATFTFEELELGDYRLVLETLGPGFDAFLVPEADCEPGGTALAGACDFALTEGTPNVTLTVYLFQPAAAPTDTDGDGLSDEDEVALGTDIDNPDSDGDGLADGVEVNEVGTDPMLADTDGDGADDADEVASGTDPNDPGSVPSP